MGSIDNRTKGKPIPPALPSGLPLLGERLSWAGLLVIFLLAFAAYTPALRGGFIWDDDRYPENPILVEKGGLRKIWTINQTDQYYPLTFSTFWLERRLWGLNPLGYHLVNLLLHIFNAVLAWVLLKRLRVPGAWAAAVLFALHPVHVESVAWVTERKNVLSAFFYLLALISYLRYEDWENRRWYWASFVLFLLAMLSKTTAATFPAILYLAHWYRGLPLDRRFALKTAPFLLLAAAFAPVTIMVETLHSGATGFEYDLSPLQRLVLAPRAIWFYAAKLAWPWRLVFNYERWTPDASDPAQWLWLLGVAAVVLALWRMRARLGRGPAAGLAFFAVSLLPALGFFNIYPQRYSYVADHFQYVSSLGLIALAAAWGYRHFGWDGPDSPAARARRNAGVLLLATVLSFFGWRTWQQSLGYRSSTVLWRTILKHNPSSFLAHNNLGLELASRGLLSEAIDHYKLALRTRPDFAEAHNNLGLALFWQGKADEAITHYNAALKLRPDFAPAKNNLGLALAGKGKGAEALKLYQRALQDRPDYALAYYNIGNIHAQQGNMNEAVRNYTLALNSWPDYPEAINNLANALANRGDTEQAIAAYKRALRAQPALPMAHINLANLLAAQGKTEEAIEHYNLAIAEKPDMPEAHNNLANVLADRGELDAAIEHYRLALKSRPGFTQARDNLELILRRRANAPAERQAESRGRRQPPR